MQTLVIKGTPLDVYPRSGMSTHQLLEVLTMQANCLMKSVDNRLLFYSILISYQPAKTSSTVCYVFVCLCKLSLDA